MRFSSFLTGAVAATVVAAHPGHDHSKEQAVRRSALTTSKRDLSHCAAKIKARGIEARNVLRRNNLAAAAMKKRGLKPREDVATIDGTHHSNASYSLDTDATTLFATNNTCVLSPEVTEGPYYVAGEWIRQDVREDQAGVSLTLDYQVLDMDTCEPIEGAFIEIWACNSTGVYAGVSASGNGDSDTDTSNLDATFLRGVQESDADGVVMFETLVPGHYVGRTQHIHTMVHLNATAAANGTLLDTVASHVGQIFFDQDLITEVEATAPYNTNTQAVTTNLEDSILAEEAATSDPYVEYILLGDTVEDGLLGWIAVGVNTTLSSEVFAAATLYATGGEASTSGPSGGGDGGPPAV